MTSLQISAVDSLGSEASRVAMVSFVEKIRAAGLIEALRADMDRACAVLRPLAVEASVKALADAREALEVGMDAAAVATFQAEMALAGIRAAQAWIAARQA